MSAPLKISDELIAFARYTINRRREVQRQLKNMPTLDDLAEELNCSRRWLEKIINNKVRVVPRGSRR